MTQDTKLFDIVDNIDDFERAITRNDRIFWISNLSIDNFPSYLQVTDAELQGLTKDELIDMCRSYVLTNPLAHNWGFSNTTQRSTHE